MALGKNSEYICIRQLVFPEPTNTNDKEFLVCQCCSHIKQGFLINLHFGTTGKHSGQKMSVSTQNRFYSIRTEEKAMMTDFENDRNTQPLPIQQAPPDRPKFYFLEPLCQMCYQLRHYSCIQHNFQKCSAYQNIIL